MRRHGHLPRAGRARVRLDRPCGGAREPRLRRAPPGTRRRGARRRRARARRRGASRRSRSSAAAAPAFRCERVAPAAPRSAIALLAFAIGVFVVSFPLVVIALRDFGTATATLVRMLLGGAVLAVAARGQMDGLRGSVTRVALIGAFGLGLQAWLLWYAMTRVGGALPALVLGLEPIVIGLVGSLVVRERVGKRLRVAFVVGPRRRGRDLGRRGGRRDRAPAAAAARDGRRRRALLAYSVSLRQLAACRRAPSSASPRPAAAVAMLPPFAFELVRGGAAQACARGSCPRADLRLGRSASGLGVSRLGRRALAGARGRRRARSLPRADRRRALVPRRPGRAALRPPRRRRRNRDRAVVIARSRGRRAGHARKPSGS